MRVVPNLYPAFERQEVVVHTPRHARSITELTHEELSLVVGVWRARAAEAHRQGFAYVQVLLNEGREAGASLPHSHSQLVWMREEPPLTGGGPAPPDCAVCNHLAEEVAAEVRRMAWTESISLLSRYAARVPYEMLAGPTEHSPNAFADDSGLDRALVLVAEGLRRLHALEGPAPVNIWLHTAPFNTEGHWRFEVVPRLTVLAGLELGAGLYVNWMPPELAAEKLRAVGV